METLRDWWGAVIALLGFGVWLIRLEGATKTALREVERIERQMEQDRASARANRQEQNDMLREMRADIKRLLERRGR